MTGIGALHIAGQGIATVADRAAPVHSPASAVCRRSEPVEHHLQEQLEVVGRARPNRVLDSADEVRQMVDREVGEDHASGAGGLEGRAEGLENLVLGGPDPLGIVLGGEEDGLGGRHPRAGA